MTDYPDSVYAPRTKENIAGISYDPAKTTTGFAEDISYLENEVLAIIDDLVGAGSANGLKGAAASFKANWLAEHSAAGAHTTDSIAEKTPDAGVTVDGIVCKDSRLGVGTSPTHTQDIKEIREGEDTGTVLHNPTNPGNPATESYRADFAYDSDGNERKITSISSEWVNADSTSGHACLKMGVTYLVGGVANDYKFLRGFGNGGASFFDTSDSPPGTDILKICGDLYVTGDIYSTALTSYTMDIAVSGGTAPTYASTKTYYQKVGKIMHVYVNLSNPSGGTAGAGANKITFSLPLAISSNFYTAGQTYGAVIGAGHAYEAGGTNVNVVVSAADATHAQLLNNDVTIHGDDQSSAEREISFHCEYPIG